MTIEGMITEADILAEVIAPNQPTLSPQLSEELLSLRFNDEATDRIRDLLRKKNAGNITDSEKATLEKYLRIGEFLDLLQAKARLSLHQGGAES